MPSLKAGNSSWKADVHLCRCGTHRQVSFCSGLNWQKSVIEGSIIKVTASYVLHVYRLLISSKIRLISNMCSNYVEEPNDYKKAKKLKTREFQRIAESQAKDNHQSPVLLVCLPFLRAFLTSRLYSSSVISISVKGPSHLATS